MTKKITIHAALGEIKKLRQRAEKKIINSSFIGCKKNSSDELYRTNVNKETFEKNVQADYESICKLLKNADDIKSKIVLSNATTKINIGEETMTVAEAIERKSSIKFEEKLLSRMTTQYNDIIGTVNVYNENMEESLDQQVTNLGGKDGSDKNKLSGYMEEYRKQNGWSVIDPIQLRNKIEELDEKIANFKNNVDVALSISNATTFIEIEE